MRIDRVELKNFRGFEHLELELHPRFTLLIGGNGSGKTNALEGLAFGLGGWIVALPDVWQHDRGPQRRDIRLELVEHGGAPSLEPRFPMESRIEGQTDDGQPIGWTRTLRSDEEDFFIDHRHPSGGRSRLADYSTRGLPEDITARYHDDLDLPVLAYYGTDRLWSDNKENGEDRDESKLGSRVRGYRSALTSKASADLFESWMAWRTEVVLQRLSELIKGGRVPTAVPSDPLLDAVQDATRRCIVGAKRFFYDVNHQQLRLELESGELIPFGHLSDGYRNLVAMVADIAWRAAQLNPHHGANAAREATGVVLIDELELHLHPAWQRRVIDDLLAAFPKLQFVATTHSPQVIASARAEHMWLLHEGRAQRPGPIRGKDSNAILRDIMGVPERPLWMKEQLEQLARLIEDGETEPARKLLVEIQADLGDDDPTVVGLQWELHDLEVHGAPDPQAKGA